MPEIELTQVKLADKKYFSIWWRDMDLIKLTSGVLEPASDIEIEEYFQEILQSKTDYHFMIGLNNKTIGHINLSKRQNDWYETQIVIGNKDYIGKGYGPKAIEILMGKATKLGINKIFLEVRPTNTRAIKAYLKSGFVNAGTIHYPENVFQPIALRMEYKK
jgi:RimJ/RimL family protein N-acetyltransferase